MNAFLQTFVVEQVFAFILIFTRTGTALMIMPGIGDSFVSARIRLAFALALSFIVTPVLAPYLPAIPESSVGFMMLILAEAVIGIFIGTVMRILMSALDTAGMVISMQTGFANALIFNPVAGGQGSLVGALLSMLGIVMIFVTNMHHYLIATVFDSYNLFPATGALPPVADMSDVIARTVNTAFNIGVRLAAPFLVVGLLIYLTFGLLGRLMPQLQIFFLALPVQILLSLITLALVFSAGILYWLGMYEETLVRTLIR